MAKEQQKITPRKLLSKKQYVRNALCNANKNIFIWTNATCSSNITIEYQYMISNYYLVLLYYLFWLVFFLFI